MFTDVKIMYLKEKYLYVLIEKYLLTKTGISATELRKY